MALNVTAAQKLFETLKGAQSQEQMYSSAEEILIFLVKQLEELRVLANGYPHNPISGDVWLDGEALAELCDALADEFSAMSLPTHEELAARLATGMACQVMGHYPEEIFPRVVRNSLCREAINQLDEAAGGYEAIIGDFEALDLRYLLKHDEELDETGRTILGAVLQAAGRLGELRPERATQLARFKETLQQRLQEKS